MAQNLTIIFKSILPVNGMTRLNILLVALSLLVCPVVVCAMNDPSLKSGYDESGKISSPFGKAPPDTIAKENLQLEQNFGEYKIRIYRNLRTGDHSILQIFRNDSLVFSDENYYFNIAENGDFVLDNEKYKNRKSTKAGSDINGDGEPDLVVFSWTGGAHGADGCYVFSIGKKFRIIYASKGDIGSWSRFKDVNNDGAMEFIAIDKNFEYWNAGYANSPFVEVILAYRGGEYRFAANLMRRQPPTPKALNKRVKEVAKDIAKELKECPDEWEWYYMKDGNFILPYIGPWQMLEFIYSGNAQTAWEFYDKIWPKGMPGKEKYLNDFKKQLVQSDYWKEIRAAYQYDAIGESIK